MALVTLSLIRAPSDGSFKKEGLSKRISAGGLGMAGIKLGLDLRAEAASWVLAMILWTAWTTRM